MTAAGAGERWRMTWDNSHNPLWVRQQGDEQQRVDIGLVTLTLNMLQDAAHDQAQRVRELEAKADKAHALALDALNQAYESSILGGAFFDTMSKLVVLLAPGQEVTT